MRACFCVWCVKCAKYLAFGTFGTPDKNALSNWFILDMSVMSFR